MREHRRKVLKNEREIREIEEAYQQMMQPGYIGDMDIDHLVEQNRKHFDEELVEVVEHEDEVEDYPELREEEEVVKHHVAPHRHAEREYHREDERHAF